MGGRNLSPFFETYISGLRKQLDGLSSEKLQLESELKSFQDMVEDFKTKYVVLSVVMVGLSGGGKNRDKNLL